MGTKLTFDQWLASEKKKDIAFGYHSLEYQSKLYEIYEEVQTFGKKDETSPKNKKTTVDEAIGKLRIELASINTIELAKLTKCVVENADLKDFIDVLPILQTQALQSKAVDEFLSGLSKGFKDAIREHVNASASEKAIKVEYCDLVISDVVIRSKLDELVDTCSQMGKSILLNKLGISGAADFDGINKSKIGKTKKWKEFH